MKFNSKMIATVAIVATVFVGSTMHSSQAQAGLFGNWWPTVSAGGLGGSR